MAENVVTDGRTDLQTKYFNPRCAPYSPPQAGHQYPDPTTCTYACVLSVRVVHVPQQTDSRSSMDKVALHKYWYMYSMQLPIMYQCLNSASRAVSVALGTPCVVDLNFTWGSSVVSTALGACIYLAYIVYISSTSS